MISIADSDISRMIPLLEKSCKEVINPLHYTDYITRVLNEKFNTLKPKYPQVIKVAAGMDELSKFRDPDGVKEVPLEREIIIKEPIIKESIPYWFDTSIKGIDLGLGYVDGDFRKPSFAALSDKDIHMLLAGNTGMGKSVAVNNIILRLCMQYAPWEVKLTMADAKVVEFKNFAMGAKIPHISAIAATGDADFLMSVVLQKRDEMIRWNTIYGGTKYKKIQDFREGYGVSVPRNLIIFDEFQVMFASAEEKGGSIKAVLTKAIDDFARLGRSTGYHLIMCSQQIGGAIPKKTLEQITVRAALGLTSETSEIVLDNTMASTIQVKGKLLYNPIRGKGNEGSNVFYKVPYADSNELVHFKEMLESLGKEFDFSYDLVFYDETYNVEEKDYMDYIQSFEPSVNKYYLGEPNYMTPSKAPRVVGMYFENDKPEHTLILNRDAKYTNRILKMLFYNMTRPGYEIPTTALFSYSIFRKGSEADKFFPEDCFNLESIVDRDDAEAYYSTIDNIMVRKLILQVEESIFDFGNDYEPIEIDRDLFEDIKSSFPELEDTSLNRRRASIARNMIISRPSTQALLGLVENSRQGLKTLNYSDIKYWLDNLLFYYWKWNASDRRLTEADMTPLCVVMAGIDKLQGIGIMQQGPLLDRLKYVLTTTAGLNVRFIIAAMEKEFITELFASIEYFFFDSDSESLASNNKIACSDFDKDIADNLVGFYTRSTLLYGRKFHKLKKMAFNGEQFKL